MKKVLTVIGTRPQFIKYAAIQKLMRRSFKETLVDTGQHYSKNLSADFIKEFGFPPPKYSLNASETNVITQISQIMRGIDGLINRVKPDMLVCFGDTNSALAAGIAALKHEIPVAHIEAGERNFNGSGRRVETSSIPEEANRTILDSISQHLLCASKQAAVNLVNEQVTGRIIYTGDIMYDLYKSRIKKALQSDRILKKHGLKHGEYIYCTIHRVLNTESRQRMLAFLNVFKKTEQTVILPIHPRTEKYLKKSGLWKRYSSLKNLVLTKPVGYNDSIMLNYNSRCVLTDSGGVVREAFFNGVPSVMLDDTSEWLGLYSSGWSTLAGADETKILNSVKKIKKPQYKPNLFGNGKAAEKTVQYLKKC